MSEFKVASRYAKSLIDLAREENALEAILQDMVQVIGVMKQSSQLRAVMANPVIKLDKKQSILDQIFGGKVHKDVAAFFNIMVRKGRAGILYATAQEFVEAYNREKNIVLAKVVSAAPLSPEHYKQVQDLIKAETKGEVVLDNQVNPDLIGGFIITIGDKQIDASVLGKLNKLEKHLKS
jgi:F-type H+-transporting ATPase subunit delta